MPATDLERLIVQLEANTTKLTKDLARVTGDVDRTARTVERRTQRMSQTITANFARAGAGIAAAFAVREVARIIGQIVEWGDKLQALSDRTGVGTDRLQQFTSAAHAANVDVSGLNETLDVFARNVGRAAEGQGELGKVFKELNIKPTGDLLDVLLQVADKVQAAKTRSEEYRIVTAALGRANGELVGFLRQGSAAITEQMQAYKALTPEAIKALADLDANWKALGATLKNIAAGPMSEVLGGIAKFLDQLQHGTWLERLQSLVALLSFGIVPQPAVGDFAKNLEKITALEEKLASLQKQRAAPGKGQQVSILDSEIAAKEAELAALKDQLLSHPAGEVKGVAQPEKPFGAEGADAEAIAAAKKRAEIEAQI